MRASSNIRPLLVAALRYPVSLIREDIDMFACAHAGQFDEGDRRCRYCDLGAECRWLSHFDQFANIDSKPDPVLVDALEFSHGYLDAAMTRAGHPLASCSCEVCSWLRDTAPLIREAQHAVATDLMR